MAKPAKTDIKAEADSGALRDDVAEGRFAYDGLDRSIHEKSRLAIMTSLLTNPAGLLFGDLKHLTSLTDGNLSRHLDVLRDAGLVEIWKGFEKRRPQTLCRITKEGRKKFTDYLQELEQVIKDARTQEIEDAKLAGSSKKMPGGWVRG